MNKPILGCKRSAMSKSKSVFLGFLSSLAAGFCLCCMVSCDYELDLNIPILGGIGSNGPGNYISPAAIERIQLDPGWLAFDSAESSGDGRVTLYGHLVPFLYKQISIAELGFLTRYSWEYHGGVKHKLLEEVEWEFQADTIVLLQIALDGLEMHQSYYGSLYVIVNNNLPEEHVNETYEYSSHPVPLDNYVVDAVNDSVSFFGSNKAILWSHLKTKKECEVLNVRFIWGRQYNVTNVDTIRIPQNVLRTDSIIILSDTIPIEIGMFYYWTTSAFVRFADGTEGFSSNEFSEFLAR